MKIIIGDYYQKVKFYAEANANKGDLFTAALIFLVGLGSFGLGRLSVMWTKHEPITITSAPTAEREGEPTTSAVQPAAAAAALKGKFVASKSSTYYHFPWCPGARRIKESNKVWFQSKEEAEAKGYKPAGNCEGL